MRRKVPLLALSLAVSVGCGVWLALRPIGSQGAKGPAAAPPVPVSVAVAARRDVAITLSGLGNVQAFNTVTVKPQVDGQLRQVLFREGQDVHTGDVLAQIDSRSFQATLDQALAKKAQDQALLANARADVQRYSALVEKNYVARQQLDTARAQAAQLDAAVQGDDAAIENARVTLGYATIRSPIDGRAGIRMVDAGNIVHASDSAGLVVITQMKPISVLFTLPEDTLARIVKAGVTPPVTVLSRDGTTVLDQGSLQLIDNQIDQNTGSVRLKAMLPNDSGLLWPGQFVNVRLQIGVEHQALTVPVAAVQRGQNGAFTFVANPAGTVEVRPITVGEITDGLAVVENGVTDGEHVVTAGQHRLRQGIPVTIRTTDGDARRSESN